MENKLIQTREDHDKERLGKIVKAYETHLQQMRKWREDNPEQIKINSQEANRKGGKYYAVKQRYLSTGIQYFRTSIRRKHRDSYRRYKQIIAPESQIHHEWIPGTADYRGTALVEADSHMHGFIDVIQILEGEITLLTEAEIRGI